MPEPGLASTEVGRINLDSRNAILEGEAYYEEILELGKK